jgi:DNA-binding MarR family transcriptional regulator
MMGIDISRGIARISRGSGDKTGMGRRNAPRKDNEMRDQYLHDLMHRLGELFPDFDHTTMRMMAALSNTYHILLSVMERALTEYGVTPQSMDVLLALYVKRGQECLLGELGEMLMVSPANITGLVEGLVRKGLATRKEHPGDRRKRLAAITPQGIALMEDFIPESARFFQEVFVSVTLQDKQQLCERLGQVSSLLLPYWEKRLVLNLRRPKSRRRHSSGRE